VYDGPHIVDQLNPTHDEIRAWAHSGALEPMQDWDLVIAEPANLDVLLSLVGDPTCPARRYLLGSLYCLVGHSDHTDPRLQDAARVAASSSDGWVSTWGHQVARVLAHPSEFHRDDWCFSNDGS